MREQQVRSVERPGRPWRRWIGRRAHPAILAGVAMLMVAGAGSAAIGAGRAAPPVAASTVSPAGGSGGISAKAGGNQGKKAANPARVAWARTYGQSRESMPNLPNVAAATAEQQAAARNLLTATEAATARFADLAVARAAGYDLQASLARAEKKKPALATAIKKVDDGSWPDGKPTPMLHVRNPAYGSDGRVLDPAAPETLMYSYQGQGSWKLIGVMFRADEAFPQAPPTPGGPITRWHYHDKAGAGGGGLMMHVFFVQGNDLAQAFATTMSG